MDSKWLKALPQFLKRIAAIGAVTYILMYIVVALIRLSYPYELECMEGMAVDHVQRILDGKPLYVAPSMEFASSIYTPLYYYVSAGVATVTGGGPLPLRLVSFLSSLGCMGLIYLFVRRETKSRYAGLIAAGLFAATYRASGLWFDLAHVDSLFVILLLAVFWILRFQRSRTSFILAALVMSAAFFVKQTAVLSAVFFALYALMARKEKGLYFPLAFVVVTGVIVFALNRASGGWFGVYAFELPAEHPLIKMQFVKFFPEDILRPLPLASILAIFYLAANWLKGARREVWFYIFLGAGFFAAAGAPRVKDGHYVSDLIPAYAFLAILLGLAIPTLLELGEKLINRLPGGDSEGEHARWYLSSFAYLGITVQLLALFYGPQNCLPTAGDRRAGDALVERLSHIKGEVWVVHHGYLGYLAGKGMHVMAQPMYDILFAHNDHATQLLTDDVERALAEHRFQVVVEDEDSLIHMSCRPDYAGEPIIYSNAGDFLPKTAFNTRPWMIYTLREDSAKLAGGEKSLTGSAKPHPVGLFRAMGSD